MNLHPNIQKKGAEAYLKGMDIEENPFKYLSTNLGGHFKAAAWDAGYIKEREKSIASTKK